MPPIHDYVIANQNGANTRSDLNNAFSAIASQNSSASEPSTTYAYMFWADTANDLLKQRNAANSAWISVLTLSTGSITTGGLDLTADQSWTGSQRAALIVDNDGSFDMNGGNNFKCTPSGNFTLTFTNITDGQSGFILLVNSGGHTISAHANSKVDANLLTTVTAAGTYLISYLSDGTNAYLTNSAIYT